LFVAENRQSSDLDGSLNSGKFSYIS